MNKTLKKLQETGVIPVAVLESSEQAAPMAEALRDGGLPCVEITFRTEAAADCIRTISEKHPEILVGAGTVLTIDQVNQALEAGAQFIVSPGLNPKITEYCLDRGITIIPGCVTPSEIERALSYGLEVIKFFPAEANGGLDMIRALAGPFTTVKFMPTGGISPSNAKNYLECDRVLACGGSWMVKKELLAAGNFGKITELAREAAEIVKKSRRR